MDEQKLRFIHAPTFDQSTRAHPLALPFHCARGDSTTVVRLLSVVDGRWRAQQLEQLGQLVAPVAAVTGHVGSEPSTCVHLVAGGAALRPFTQVAPGISLQQRSATGRRQPSAIRRHRQQAATARLEQPTLQQAPPGTQPQATGGHSTRHTCSRQITSSVCPQKAAR